MEKVREGPELGSGMEEPASPQEPASPPPPPSPPSPAAPETPRLPAPESPTEAHARQLLLQEWAPPRGSLELPPRLTWKLLFLRRPLYRNLLRSPNPEGAGRWSARSWSSPEAATPPSPSRGLAHLDRRSRLLFAFLSLLLCSRSLSLDVSLCVFISLRPSLGLPPPQWHSGK